MTSESASARAARAGCFASVDPARLEALRARRLPQLRECARDFATLDANIKAGTLHAAQTAVGGEEAAVVLRDRLSRFVVQVRGALALLAGERADADAQRALERACNVCEGEVSASTTPRSNIYIYILPLSSLLGARAPRPCEKPPRPDARALSALSASARATPSASRSSSSSGTSTRRSCPCTAGCARAARRA